MFHPHSNYIWTELLSRLVIVSLFSLLLLTLASQLVMLHRLSPAQSGERPHPTGINSNKSILPIVLTFTAGHNC